MVGLIHLQSRSFQLERSAAPERTQLVLLAQMVRPSAAACHQRASSVSGRAELRGLSGTHHHGNFAQVLPKHVRVDLSSWVGARERMKCRFFYPTIQLHPRVGARTLLHIGTHRREYKDLDPNNLYYMQWRFQGLVKSPFVEDVGLGESRAAFDWLFSLYKKLRNASMVIGETTEIVRGEEMNQIARNRSQSL